MSIDQYGLYIWTHDPVLTLVVICRAALITWLMLLVLLFRFCPVWICFIVLFDSSLSWWKPAAQRAAFDFSTCGIFISLSKMHLRLKPQWSWQPDFPASVPFLPFKDLFTEIHEVAFIRDFVPGGFSLINFWIEWLQEKKQKKTSGWFKWDNISSLKNISRGDLMHKNTFFSWLELNSPLDYFSVLTKPLESHFYMLWNWIAFSHLLFMTVLQFS